MSGPLDVTDIKVDPSVALSVPASLTLRRRLLPFARVDGVILVACGNPSDTAAIRALQRHFKGETVRPIGAEPRALQALLQRTYGGLQQARGGTGRFQQPGTGRFAQTPATARDGERGDGDDDDGSVALGEELLRSATIRQASDVHIDPRRDGIRVRFRVDGQLEEFQRLPLEALSGLISRFKVLADMDIAEKRAPQDGRFSYTYAPGQEVELRVATLPTKYGERMTLRLLALDTAALTLERLGMHSAQLETFDHQLAQPHGLILVTGPTGSGKSTTLYAALRRLVDSRPLNVITVEDPIEFDIDDVAQVEVDSVDKVGFQRALRSLLRHDPDVVMIGEIRDGETADVALKAALTGHLVLSTLHTNSAVGAVTRLRDMGLAPYLLAASLRLAVAQRLVRRVCQRCAQPRELTADEVQQLGDLVRPGLAPPAEWTVFEPRGCMYCAGRGFAGRTGLFEVVRFDAAWGQRIARGDDEPALLDAMRVEGVPTLVDAAVEAVSGGLVPLADALAAVALQR